MTMMMEITMATMGRLMKNLDTAQGGTGLKGSSADFQSAVSPICNRQAYVLSSAAEHGPLAECNSAKQQIENLRYGSKMLA